MDTQDTIKQSILLYNKFAILRFDRKIQLCVISEGTQQVKNIQTRYERILSRDSIHMGHFIDQNTNQVYVFVLEYGNTFSVFRFDFDRSHHILLNCKFVYVGFSIFVIHDWWSRFHYLHLIFGCFQSSKSTKICDAFSIAIQILF